jgi:hypothetical protein
LDEDTLDQDPNDAFGQALARAAERRANGSHPTGDDWLTTGDAPLSATSHHRSAKDTEPANDWLTSEDAPPAAPPSAAAAAAR